jgi:hypothetical protein
MVWVKTRAELIEHFNSQRQALIASSAGYDAGHYWEASRLATAVYQLVHDGGRNSRSILTQLGLRASLRFLSTGEASLLNMIRDTPLIAQRISGDGTAQSIPLLDGGPPGEFTSLQFPTWWERSIIFQDGNHKLTRKKLVFSLRNQDGGSHTDPSLTDEAYVRIAREQFSTPRAVFPTGDVAILGAEHATMRQIAFEVLKSFEALGTVT